LLLHVDPVDEDLLNLCVGRKCAENREQEKRTDSHELDCTRRLIAAAYGWSETFSALPSL
jgi:hypothetical protein